MAWLKLSVEFHLLQESPGVYLITQQCHTLWLPSSDYSFTTAPPWLNFHIHQPAIRTWLSHPMCWIAQQFPVISPLSLSDADLWLKYVLFSTEQELQSNVGLYASAQHPCVPFLIFASFSSQRIVCFCRLSLVFHIFKLQLHRKGFTLDSFQHSCVIVSWSILLWPMAWKGTTEARPHCKKSLSIRPYWSSCQGFGK